MRGSDFDNENVGFICYGDGSFVLQGMWYGAESGLECTVRRSMKGYFGQGYTHFDAGAVTEHSYTTVLGPLGRATEMDGLKKVCVVGGGVGCAIAYPIAKEMHKKGIEVTFIGGFRSADIVILKDELKEASDKLIMCTDDGTYGEKGFTTQYLKQEIDANIAEGKPQFDRVIAIGPDIMMKFLADTTRPYGIKTIISLDPIMVDGTGMCGGCRVIVGGETKFACVDGPDFDAHEVDFDSLIKRAAFYKEEQDEAAKHICNMTGGKRNG